MKNILIGVLALAVAGLLGVVGFHDTSPKLGSVASPDIPSPYFSYGDIRHWAAKSTVLNQATTTVCALQSPAATSTLGKATIRIDSGTTTASTIYMAKATTPYATTTSLGSAALAANAMGTFVASTTDVVAKDPIGVFAPNTYFVVGMAGGIGNFSPTGSCEATWVES